MSAAPDARAERELVMLVDGECGVCRRIGAWVARHDRTGRIELLALQHPSVAIRFPALPAASLEAALHVVARDGRVWSGAAACAEIARALPLGWTWGWTFALPGAEWAYRTFAATRSRTCRLPLDDINRFT